MSYATIRGAIKTALEAVAGITGGAGIVTAFLPHITRREDFETFYVAGGVVNGWTITRQGLEDNQQDAGFRYQNVHRVLVSGYAQVKVGTADTGEEAFQDLVDAVHLAIRGSVAIWVAQPEDNENAIQSQIITPVMFSDVLCHKVEMRFGVEEFVEISS